MNNEEYDNDELETLKKAKEESKNRYAENILKNIDGVEKYGFWEQVFFTTKKHIGKEIPKEYTWMFDTDKDKRRNQKSVLLVKMERFDTNKSKCEYLQNVASLVFAEHEYKQGIEDNERFFQRNEGFFKEFKYWIDQEIDNLFKSDIQQLRSESKLTSYQKALKQWYLEGYEAKIKLQGRAIGKDLGQSTCEGFLNAIRKHYDDYKKHNYSRKGVIKDFERVKNELINYPIALKAITNDIDINLT